MDDSSPSCDTLDFETAAEFYSSPIYVPDGNASLAFSVDEDARTVHVYYIPSAPDKNTGRVEIRGGGTGRNERLMFRDYSTTPKFFTAMRRKIEDELALIKFLALRKKA